jgi:cell division protease FtsH
MEAERREAPPGAPKPTPAPAPRRFLLAYLMAGLVFAWVWQESFDRLAYERIPYSAFQDAVGRGEAREVAIGERWIEGRIAPNPPGDGVGPVRDPYLFRSARVEDPGLAAALAERGVAFTGVHPSFLSQFLLAWGLPLLLMAALWIFLSRRMGAAGGALASFGRSRAKLAADDQTGVRFDDVAGCDEAKQELAEVVDFLRNPARYRVLGAKIPKGVLLVGPPGTGKTLVARAVAGEAGTPFFSISGSDFVEMFAGVGAARVRDLFAQAKAKSPCIVFIDEIDAIGRQRGGNVAFTHDEREQTLNQLLVEMDGFEANSGVILLAATNRPEILDRALLRPGRFDRQVLIDVPDVEGRLAILRVHARGKPVAADAELAAIARATPGFAGADLANVLNEAALLAAREGRAVIRHADLEAAVEKVVAGPERRSRRLSPAQRRRVAIHEVGHALVAASAPHADPLHKISIVPRGRGALGWTLQLPNEEAHLFSRSALRDRVRVLLGGRAAEEEVLGEPSTGAQDDLERATALVREMVTSWGMAESAGLVHWAAPRAQRMLGSDGFPSAREISDQTAREIDAEVRAVLERLYAEARELLTRRRAALDAVADALVERETLDAAAFHAIVSEAEGGAKITPLRPVHTTRPESPTLERSAS